MRTESGWLNSHPNPMSGLDYLSDVDTVPVDVFKDESTQAIILVLQVFDDPCAMLLANRMQRIDIVHQQVGNVEVRSLVSFLQGQMQLAAIPLQDHETDGISIFEDFVKAENIGVEAIGFFHVLDGNHSGNPTETDTVISDFIHRITSACEATLTVQTVLDRCEALRCWNEMDGANRKDLTRNRLPEKRQGPSLASPQRETVQNACCVTMPAILQKTSHLFRAMKIIDNPAPSDTEIPYGFEDPFHRRHRPDFLSLRRARGR
ncbi:hypothetical protein FHX06_000305 [Rhizobium sp. BK512]|nr:hypothetical protein [Rhizobium sp. BK512]